ncbi:MAG: putative DMT superfamily transporter inner membrane protein [Candidatus Bathyarchaeota archaeon BA1]|nr:MAG: putative DMT superfamily transporter inner membrane protein [Candidatus Bathyarchaeota archaeon BA1]
MKVKAKTALSRRFYYQKFYDRLKILLCVKSCTGEHITMNGSHVSSKLNFSFIDAMLIGMSLIWGINFSIVKTALTELSPSTFNSLRFGLASLFMLILLWIFERDIGFRRKDIARLILLGLIGNTVYQLCFINGIARTTASNSSLILATTPIFVALLSSALGLERVERRVWYSITLSFIGILSIVEGSGKVLTVTDQSVIGDLLILEHHLLGDVYGAIKAAIPEVYTP